LQWAAALTSDGSVRRVGKKSAAEIDEVVLVDIGRFKSQWAGCVGKPNNNDRLCKKRGETLIDVRMPARCARGRNVNSVRFNVA
jgi:hypothetical protein